jgi:hypothetical protein
MHAVHADAVYMRASAGTDTGVLVTPYWEGNATGRKQVENCHNSADVTFQQPKEQR